MLHSRWLYLTECFKKVPLPIVEDHIFAKESGQAIFCLTTRNPTTNCSYLPGINPVLKLAGGGEAKIATMSLIKQYRGRSRKTESLHTKQESLSTWRTLQECRKMRFIPGFFHKCRSFCLLCVWFHYTDFAIREGVRTAQLNIAMGPIRFVLLFI